jgi:hypothetical protein
MFGQITALIKNLNFGNYSFRKKTIHIMQILKNHKKYITPGILGDTIGNLRNEFSYRFETL